MKSPRKHKHKHEHRLSRFERLAILTCEYTEKELIPFAITENPRICEDFNIHYLVTGILEKTPRPYLIASNVEERRINGEYYDRLTEEQIKLVGEIKKEIENETIVASIDAIKQKYAMHVITYAYEKSSLKASLIHGLERCHGECDSYHDWINEKNLLLIYYVDQGGASL
jgi:hypothetical protein